MSFWCLYTIGYSLVWEWGRGWWESERKRKTSSVCKLKYLFRKEHFFSAKVISSAQTSHLMQTSTPIICSSSGPFWIIYHYLWTFVTVICEHILSPQCNYKLLAGKGEDFFLCLSSYVLQHPEESMFVNSHQHPMSSARHCRIVFPNTLHDKEDYHMLWSTKAQSSKWPAQIHTTTAKIPTQVY
jgi:hypothetical protein